VKTTIAVMMLLLMGLIEPRAERFGPQFCAAQFQRSPSELGSEFRAIAVYFSNGRTMWEKATPTEWVSCMCSKADHVAGQACECCAYDLQLVCAENARLNAATNDRVRMSVCAQEQK
jgi:hypothetical protein